MAQTLNVHCNNHKQQNATYFDSEAHEFLCNQCCEGKTTFNRISLGRIESLIQNAIKLLELNEYVVTLFKSKEDIDANINNAVNMATQMEKSIKKELNTKDKEMMCMQVMNALKKGNDIDEIRKAMNTGLEKTVEMIKVELKASNEKALEIIGKGKSVMNFSNAIQQNEIEIGKYQRNEKIEEIVKNKIFPEEKEFRL